jgi:hypothetical protein
MPSPPSPTDWKYGPRHVPSFVRGFLLALLGGLLVLEAVSRLLLTTGFVERVVPPAGRLVSVPQIEDRLRASREHPGRRVLFLTDSVGGMSALLEKGYDGATRASLTARLTEEARSKGASVVPLAADGLLLPDLAALAELASRERFDAILILLNTRMFAPEFKEADKAFSRVFLVPVLPEFLRIDEGYRARPMSPSIRLEKFLHRHWVTFRVTQTLKTLWYHPTPKDAWTRLARRLSGTRPGPRQQDDLEEAALKLKVLPYYPTGPWKGLPMNGLGTVLAKSLVRDVPVHVVFTPQNTAFLGSEFDPTWLKRNLASLRTLMRQFGGDLRYEDWSDRYGSDLFLDHCHLTPEGNERLARDLAALIAGRRP